MNISGCSTGTSCLRSGEKLNPEKDVPTPHVHDPKPPHPPEYAKWPCGNETIPREATLGDIDDALIHVGGSLPNIVPISFQGVGGRGQNGPPVLPSYSPPVPPPQHVVIPDV